MTRRPAPGAQESERDRLCGDCAKLPKSPDPERRLRAALGFLQLEPRAPELRLLHRWLDSWTGLGLVVVGVERQGLRFSMSHIASTVTNKPSGWTVQTGRSEGVSISLRQRRLRRSSSQIR